MDYPFGWIAVGACVLVGILALLWVLSENRARFNAWAKRNGWPFK